MQAPPKKRSIRLVPLLAGAAITALLLLVSKSSSGARQLEQGVDLDGAAAGGRVAAWEAAGSRWPKTRVGVCGGVGSVVLDHFRQHQCVNRLGQLHASGGAVGR